MGKLKVVYDGEGVNRELDDTIELALKRFGYKRWASGFDLASSKRDLAFEKDHTQGDKQ